MPTVNFSPLAAAATDAEATVEDAAAEDAEEEPPQAEKAAAAPRAAAAVRKERRVILRILMISSISSPCSQQDAALRADIVSGSNKVRFTLVKYNTESLAKTIHFYPKTALIIDSSKVIYQLFRTIISFFPDTRSVCAVPCPAFAGLLPAAADSPARIIVAKIQCLRELRCIRRTSTGLSTASSYSTVSSSAMQVCAQRHVNGFPGGHIVAGR